MDEKPILTISTGLTNVTIPPKTELHILGYDGFYVVMPNGTDIHALNAFLGEALGWTWHQIVEERLHKESWER